MHEQVDATRSKEKSRVNLFLHFVATFTIPLKLPMCMILVKVHMPFRECALKCASVLFWWQKVHDCVFFTVSQERKDLGCQGPILTLIPSFHFNLCLPLNQVFG